MMTSRSLICLLKNQNGGKLQKLLFEHALPYFLSNDRILVDSTLHFIVLYVIRICKFKIWSLNKSFIFLFIVF
jgi:hypothetical protein